MGARALDLHQRTPAARQPRSPPRPTADQVLRASSSRPALDEDLSGAEELRPILWQCAETAGLAGGGITLKFKTAAFRTITRARRLDRPTQSAEEMFRAAVPLLADEANGCAFRLIGIGAHDLVGAREVNQSDLFASLSPAEGRSTRRLTRCGRSSARTPSSGDAGSAPGSSARDPPRSSEPPVPLVRALQRVRVPTKSSSTLGPGGAIGGPLAGSGYWACSSFAA